MGQFFKMFFASLLAMIIAGFIMFGFMMFSLTAITKSVTERERKVLSGNVLAIDLGSQFHETTVINSLALFNDNKEYQVGIYDMIRTLDKAKNDPGIKGIIIKLKGTPNGWATLQQLREALADFKTSGKFIYAYGEDIPQAAYYVGSIADSIYLNPAGEMELKGFATMLAFFKGTLEKLEVEPEIYYAGKFKSATEPFRADKISDPNRIQIQAYQSGIWNEFVAAVAEFSHADKATVNEWAQQGTIKYPTDAMDKKLVSGLLYWDEVEQRIRAKTGMKNTTPVKMIAFEDYAENNKGAIGYGLPKVAILTAEGEIEDGSSEKDFVIASQTFCDQVRKLAADSMVKAVVLRVNSPGGSALASEVILRELNLLHSKKPVVVSMGDLAASGGYYMSCQADSIFALPTTLTGSIGVFSMLFNVDKMMKNKLGVTFDEVKNAPYADLPSAFRPLNAEEAGRMQGYVDKIYGMFKNRVATGRKLDPAIVDSIAQGRVWVGEDALRIHLVDGMGGLKRAICSAAALAHISNYRTIVYPETEDKLDQILRKLKKNNSAEEMVKSAIKNQTGLSDDWVEKLRSLSAMNGKAMMAMPFLFNLR